MALFGPKDRNLPLLTQLYQVEEDNVEEMDAMLNQRRGWTPTGAEGLEGTEQQTKPVMDLHRLARRLMNRAIDGAVEVGDVWDINRYWKQNGREFGFRARGELVKVSGTPPDRSIFSTTVLPLTDLTMVRYNFNDAWMDFETEIVHELAGLLLSQGKYLARCPQCESVFLASRQGQRFCSHRCQNRAGVRRMAARKRSSKENSRVAVFR